MPSLTINPREVLGADADALLSHESKTVSKSALHLPGPDFVDRVLMLGNERTLDRPFDGVIYDVKVWNSALDAQAIEDNADAFLHQN